MRATLNCAASVSTAAARASSSEVSDPERFFEAEWARYLLSASVEALHELQGGRGGSGGGFSPMAPTSTGFVMVRATVER